MNQPSDQAFYDRADAHIDLANQQLEQREGHGKVSASMTFAATRFSAWIPLATSSRRRKWLKHGKRLSSTTASNTG